jgi:hypothetical protein
MVPNQFGCNGIRLYKGGLYCGLRGISDFCAGNDDIDFPPFVVTIITVLFYRDATEYRHSGNVTFKSSGLMATEE